MRNRRKWRREERSGSNDGERVTVSEEKKLWRWFTITSEESSHTVSVLTRTQGHQYIMCNYVQFGGCG